MNDSMGTVVDEKTPTSTSKALMLSLSVPRICRIYIPSKDLSAVSQEARQNTLLAQQSSERNSLDSSLAPSLSTVSDPSMIPKVAILHVSDSIQQQEPVLMEDIRVVQIHNEYSTSERMMENEVGYVEANENEGRRVSVVQHVVTKEEMEMIVKLAHSDEGHMPIVQGEELKCSKTQVDSPVDATTMESTEGFLGVINSINQDTGGAHLSREEAVAAIKLYGSLSTLTDVKSTKVQGDVYLGELRMKPNTEIKLGELLQLTVRALYRENHFYNAPIYTAVQARIVPEAPEVDDWLEVSVMVKHTSIGIVLERLERIGVGCNVGTIALYKAELLRTCDILYDNVLQGDKISNDEEGNTEVTDSEAVERNAKAEAARVEWKNAACRLRIEQVKEEIEEQTELGLDYMVLLSVASMLAGIGLVIDSAVIIVASMLVSPLMGPVLGMSFGTLVRDWKFTWKSSRNELLSLMVSVLIGAITGICTSFCPIAEEWPTEQMFLRGDRRGLLAGIAIAIPSGFGVALSILGNNTASLVGVAISASLLPPAVNAGLCWVYAILIRCGVIENVKVDPDGNLYDFNVIAGVSFVLTMVNVVCIWVSAVIMFNIKEVAPARSKSAFWSQDIKVARAVQNGSKSSMNLEAVKSGLQYAITKERKEKNMKKKQQKFVILDIEADDPVPLVMKGASTNLYSLEDMTKIVELDQEDLESVDDAPSKRVRRRRYTMEK